MRCDRNAGTQIPRSYIGSTEDTKHLTNDVRRFLRAEEKRLRALKREEIRKRKELEQIETEKSRIEGRMLHREVQTSNPDLMCRYRKMRNRKRFYSCLKWSGIALVGIAVFALIVWLICELLWVFLAIIVLPAWLIAALGDGAKV